MEIEEAVIAKIRQRRDTGRKKYGQTMERGDLKTLDWLKHAQEEAMDLAIYLERLLSDGERTQEQLDWAESIICNALPMDHCSKEDWASVVKSWRDWKNGVAPGPETPKLKKPHPNLKVTNPKDIGKTLMEVFAEEAPAGEVFMAEDKYQAACSQRHPACMSCRYVGDQRLASSARSGDWCYKYASKPNLGSGCPNFTRRTL